MGFELRVRFAKIQVNLANKEQTPTGLPNSLFNREFSCFRSFPPTQVLKLSRHSSALQAVKLRIPANNNRENFYPNREFLHRIRET
jgi:hypothetical protein